MLHLRNKKCLFDINGSIYLTEIITASGFSNYMQLQLKFDTVGQSNVHHDPIILYFLNVHYLWLKCRDINL